MKNSLVFLNLQYPEGSGGYVFRHKLIMIFEAIEDIDEIICLHADPKFDDELLKFSKVKSIKVSNYTNYNNIIVRGFLFIAAQMSYLYYLIKMRECYSKVVVMCGNTSALSLFLLKFLKKEKIYLLSGFNGFDAITSYLGDSYRKNYLYLIYLLIFSMLEEISLYLSDVLVLESPSLYKKLRGSLRNKKIYKNGYLFQETSNFSIKKQFSERKNIIGFIGRFNYEKGITNFVESLPLINNLFGDIEVVLIGWGPLFEEINQKIKILGLKNIKIIGKIDQTQVPTYLNELKLLVIPSINEGLPNILLEAMACGTPVLASDVGGIPDVIKEGNTGFLLHETKADYIADRVYNILKNEDLVNISEKESFFINEHFSFIAAVDRYQKIFSFEVDR